MKRLLFGPVLLSLAACGGPVEPAQPTSLTRHASLLVGEEGFAFNYKVFAVAGFNLLQTPFSGTLPENPLADAADTCVVSSGNNTDPLAQFDFLAAPLGEGQSVGGPLTLLANGAPYMTLPERDFFGSPLYGNLPSDESAAEPPLPETLTVEMPLDFYEEVGGATLTPVTRLEWSAPGQDDVITPETTFSWTAADDGALIGFQVTQANDAGTDDDLNVFCLATDDGSFTFPAETQEALSNLDAGSLMLAGRLGLRYERREDTALLLASSSYLVYNLTAD